MKKYTEKNKEKLVNGPDVFAETYSVELYMKENPIIFEKELLANINKYCSNVELVAKQDNNTTFAFNDYVLEYKNISAPVSIIISVIYDKPDEEKLRNSLGQSLNFNNKEAIEECKYRVLVTDVMAIGLEYTKRIELFQKALYAIVELMPCEGIHFHLTEQFISREDYLENNPSNDDYDLLLGILNVRLFKAQGMKDEYIMDTLGLSAVGLCDLQCHFKNLDPDQISNLLYSYGYYIFDNQDAADNLNTVEGITEDNIWKCRHEVSIVKPERVVLDINPGKGFSGGNRG
ncbi:DUF4261 domain-containing protein [Clostridium chromiireducens]|uniref:DUF4261 domain-containing protein n=1 Tax=Clostridium chromiireducens TaxID=225345 RepID=A0A1V4IIC1_9CLOT|nr:DUF4261 domain-containing protein [Clostridium chromiireducens]OPJ59247.1 hypothetical protein CLCHR_35600 [Clostridium chromiireducens]RII34770.1 DUF4261 domain-containing protein [Clostridium chromiireducens]